MIKGALLLGVGFALGYAKASSEQDAVRKAAEKINKILDTATTDNETEKETPS